MTGKPVTEWSDDVLRRVLTEEKSPGTPLLVAALDELLRRVEEKAAAKMRHKAKAVALEVAFECGEDGRDGWRGQVAARDIAERIGRLQ